MAAAFYSSYRRSIFHCCHIGWDHFLYGKNSKTFVKIGTQRLMARKPFLKPTVCVHMSGHRHMHTHMHTCRHSPYTHRRMESQGEFEKEKKRKEKALIYCFITLWDWDKPAHKSGFYGLCSVPTPLASSLWSPLLAESSQDPRWPAPWRHEHPLTVGKNNTKIHWKQRDLHSIKPVSHWELRKKPPMRRRVMHVHTYFTFRSMNVAFFLQFNYPIALMEANSSLQFNKLSINKPVSSEHLQAAAVRRQSDWWGEWFLSVPFFVHSGQRETMLF